MSSIVRNKQNLKLHSFIIIFGTVIIFLCFLIAIISSKRCKPVYFKYIFLFVVLGLLLSANTITSEYNVWRNAFKTRIFIEQIITFSQYVLLALVFVDLLKHSSYKNKLKWLLIISTPIQVGFILIVHIGNIEIRPNIIPNIVLIFCCLFYIRDLMNNNPTLVIIQSSAFWLVMGIFFSSCIGFPVGTLMPFISKSEEYINLRFQIFSIFNMSIILLYLFIIKSYLCLKHPQIL